MNTEQIHLADEALVGFVQGEASGEAAREVQRHLDGCSECRQVVAELARSSAATHHRPGTPRSELAPGGQIGRYELRERIGQGAMGSVYQAFDPRLNRSVALKLLRFENGGLMGEARLFREAHAMAQLAHPNVVGVHDVGIFEGNPFLAMELVRGTTLEDWIAARPHPWRAVVRQLLAAARGLAAAHAVGIVHRDFKPQNVLVSEDGAVKVTDFGLARWEGAPHEQPRGEDFSGSSVLPSADSLTATGTVAGTPYYMAPEVMDGNGADARSDQFSFAVTLYEALHGQRPFTGQTYSELAHSVRSGIVADPPPGRRAPRFVRQVIARGLSREPADRFPSMSALVTELERGLVRGTRGIPILVGAAASLVLCAGIVGVGVLESRRQRCNQGQARSSALWGSPQRAKVERAFTATGVGVAADIFRRTDAELEQLRGAWARAEDTACRETFVQRAQPELVWERREACLSRIHSRTVELVELFGTADARLVRRAQLALERIPAAEDCLEPAGSGGTAVPRAQRALAASLDADLARADSLIEGRRETEVIKIATRVEAEAKAAGLLDLMAQAQQLRAGISTGGTKDRGALHHAVLLTAESVGDDALKIEALLSLSRVALLEHDVPGAKRWMEEARATLTRMGLKPGRLEERVLRGESDALLEARDIEPALAKLAEARALVLRTEGPKTLEYAHAISQQAKTVLDLERIDEALALTREAVAVREQVLGPGHPSLAMDYNGVGASLFRQGKLEDARAALDHALDLSRDDGDEILRANIMNNLAAVLHEMHRWKESDALWEETYQLRAKVLGPDAPDTAQTLVNIGAEYVDEGKYDEARAHIEKGLELYRHAGRPFEAVADAWISLGKMDLLRKQPKLAYAKFEKAEAVGREVFKADNPYSSIALSLMARSRQQEKKTAEARTLMERALRQFEHQGWSHERADASLWEAELLTPGRSRASEPAIALSRAALKQYTQEKNPESIAQVTAWTREHGPRR